MTPVHFPYALCCSRLRRGSDLAVQGQTREAKLLMLYTGDQTLDEGMGVCVETDASTACDYRISEMPRRYHSHKECTLAFIPPELRG